MCLSLSYTRVLQLYCHALQILDLAMECSQLQISDLCSKWQGRTHASQKLSLEVALRKNSLTCFLVVGINPNPLSQAGKCIVRKACFQDDGHRMDSSRMSGYGHSSSLFISKLTCLLNKVWLHGSFFHFLFPPLLLFPSEVT